MGKHSGEKQVLANSFSKKESIKEKIYLLIIEWGTYLILFTPLILTKNFFFPYVGPKTIFFRILVDIIFIAFLLLVVANPRYRPKFNALSWSIIAFLGVSFISSFFGVDFIRSFWSTFERMTGLITFLHLFAFFLVLTSVFRERKYWDRILTVSILAGVILSFYIFNSADPSSRGGGTLGNSSFMNAYMLFNIFFTIILFFIKKGWWKLFYGLALIPMAYLLLSPLFFPSVERTDGAIGAFAGGLFLLFFGFLIFHLFSFKKKPLRISAVALIVIFILAGIGFTKTEFFKSNIARIAQTGSWEARQVVWTMSFQAWKEKPWLGWGEDNFNTAFVKYYDPVLPLTADVWYDRAHNIVFDLLVSSGIIGLLSYLAIFVIAIIGLFKLCGKISEKKNLFLPLGMISLLAAYFAQNIWVFDMISSYMMFFLSLSFIYFLIEGGKKGEIKEVEKRGPHSLLIAFLIIITLFAVYFGNIKPAQSSNYLVRSLYLPLDQAITNFQKAISVSPIGRTEGSEQFSRKMVDFSYRSDVDKELLKKGFGLAEEEMKKAIEQNPLDFRAYLVLGKQYNTLFYFSGDQGALILAEETLLKGKELSPKNQQVYWELSQNMLFQGKEEEAIKYMQTSVDLEPKFATPYWYLGLVYKTLGKYELASEKVEKAGELGYNWKDSPDDLNKVIGIYQELRDDANLIKLYSLALNMNPKNAQFWAGQAVALANLGQFKEARESAQKAIELNPDFVKELEEFLKSLPTQ